MSTSDKEFYDSFVKWVSSKPYGNNAAGLFELWMHGSWTIRMTSEMRSEIATAFNCGRALGFNEGTMKVIKEVKEDESNETQRVTKFTKK